MRFNVFALARNAAIGQLLFHALINDALMRRMLIDDNNPLIRLRNHVVFMDLSQGRTQRMVR